MRVLVAWDDSREAELLALYLNVGSSQAVIHTDLGAFRQALSEPGVWDAVLLPIDRPDEQSGLGTFLAVRETLPDCPVVAACHLRSTYQLARFLAQGLRAYVIRDDARDFIFLLHATLQGTVEAVTAERERHISAQLREEVESVRRLQEAIIPRSLPQPEGYAVCGRYESAELRVLGGRSVVLAGGDYYDVFAGDGGQTFFLMGDAAGHGMKACLSVMIMHTLLQMIRDRRYEDTAAFMRAVNRHLCDQAVIREGGGFITLLFARLDPATHALEWTSAGHPLPLLHRLEENSVAPLGSVDDAGMALGILEEADYVSVRSQIPDRGRVLLYTDGLEEAFPTGREECRQFGQAGIARTLRSLRHSALQQAMQGLFFESNAHTEGAGRHDDTTVVLLERSR
jgi:phosphoserine phosphatase RsbU/P